MATLPSLVEPEPASTSLLAVQPTSVLSPLGELRPTASGEPSWAHQSGGRGQPPVANPDSAADEWRPVQATPPLRPAQTLIRPEQANLLSSSTTTTEKGPSVQADDVHEEIRTPQGDASPPTTTTEINSRLAGRPKRPSLGFNGQGVRGRQSSPSAAPASTSTQASSSGRLFKQIGEATSQPGSTINGIRRPGLNGGRASSSSTTTAAPASVSSPEVGAGTANAFQSRLANANQRLRNRFKHRNNQHSNSTASTGNGLLTPQVSALIPPTEGGSGHLLEVGSIEQPSLVSSPSRLGSSDEPSPLTPGTTTDKAPVVASEEILISAASLRPSSSPEAASSQPTVGEAEVTLEPVDAEQQAGLKALSRAGEQKPPSGPRLVSGELQQGQLSSGPLNFDTLFQNDQPAQTSSPPVGSQESPSEHQVSHLAAKETRPSNKKSHNDKLNGWLDQHHNKFVPRPAPGQQQEHSGHLSHQLANSLNQLAPSFASNIPSDIHPTKPTPSSTQTVDASTARPSVQGEESTGVSGSEMKSASNATTDGSESGDNEATVQMQTITKTYSTVMTSIKTRLVPLQVKSSTAIHTITENYVITKMLTAYQTLPVGGEFLLPEPLSTRAPFEMFNEINADQEANKSAKEQPISAPAPAAVHNMAPPVETQEQPISLDTSPKTANDWLHDFTSNDNANPLDQFRSAQQQQQTNSLAQSILEQQGNLVGLGLGNEPLDQLASTLDPAALLADGTINIPDLNNPIVLAAAIQNPQLAAVILAAQQLQLKQRQNKLNNANNQQAVNNMQPVQLQPSYSTSLSTTIRPSTYTVRDTMFTTRLVSFKDGRTVRTRTVSEPGSVIEQVLTTMATEVTPITITIRPTAALGVPTATGLPSGGQQSSQTTINNALIATQLAALLARRQQQLQPSLGAAGGSNPFGASPGASATPQQLLAFQQLLQQQQRAINGNNNNNNSPTAKQFQPNLQQLLQSMQQQPQNNAANLLPASSSPPSTGSTNRQQNKPEAGQQQQQQQPAVAPTPSLPSLPTIPLGPITTTLTSLQVRTYTVHNAFKTIFRTITSTQLITSTIYPGGVRSTATPTNLG